MPWRRGGERTLLGLSALGGSLIALAAIYSAATVIGIPLPKPAFNYDITQLRRVVDMRYSELDRRLSVVERHQLESIVIALQGQLTSTEREIREFVAKGMPIPGSAKREKMRLEREVKEYERRLRNNGQR